MLLNLRNLYILLILFANASSAQVSPFVDSLNRLFPTFSEKEQFDYILLHIDDISGKDIQQGKTLIMKAIDLAVQNSWKNKEVQAKIKLAKIEYLSGDYEQSSKLNHEVLDYYEAENDLARAGNQLNFMALSQSQLGRYDKAISYLDQALTNCKAANDSACISVSYDHKGLVFMRMKKPESAMEPFLICLQIRKNIKDTLGLGYIYDNLSWAYTEMSQFDKALEMAKKAMDIRNLLGIQIDIAVNINNIGEVYFAKKDYKTAIKYFDESLEKSLKIGFTDLSRHTYEFISKAYGQLGDFEKANLYLKNSYALKDSLMNVEKTKTILELETRYETERKEKTIQLQALEIDKAETHTKIIIYSSIAVFLMLILIGAFAYFYYKNKREAREKQKELDNQQQLIEATIEATEEERKRISRDLHDGVGQQLSGLKMGWQRLSNKINSGTLTSSDGINELTKILDEATNDVRTISHQMMPKSLSEFGLVPTLEDMLEKSFAQIAIQYDFDSFGITKRFDEKIEIAVFRIAQELVNNILKHSEAKEVEIQLYQTKGNLILSVADNGKGLQSEKSKTKGHGMMNMQSRAKAISAEIHFEKNGDGGLVSVLRVPV
jgi:two-component system, NarL family, sensor kinase